MKKDDRTTSIQELKDNSQSFRAERGWGKTAGTPRNLATSIIVEAAELLEHFQWGEYKTAERQEVIDELADILNYCFALAETLDVDLATACTDKLERARQKFPTAIFNPDNDAPELYKQIKKNYRENKKP